MRRLVMSRYNRDMVNHFGSIVYYNNTFDFAHASWFRRLSPVGIRMFPWQRRHSTPDHTSMAPSNCMVLQVVRSSRNDSHESWGFANWPAFFGIDFLLGQWLTGFFFCFGDSIFRENQVQTFISGSILAKWGNDRFSKPIAPVLRSDHYGHQHPRQRESQDMLKKSENSALWWVVNNSFWSILIPLPQMSSTTWLATPKPFCVWWPNPQILHCFGKTQLAHLWLRCNGNYGLLVWNLRIWQEWNSAVSVQRLAMFQLLKFIPHNPLQLQSFITGPLQFEGCKWFHNTEVSQSFRLGSGSLEVPSCRGNAIIPKTSAMLPANESASRIIQVTNQ